MAWIPLEQALHDFDPDPTMRGLAHASIVRPAQAPAGKAAGILRIRISVPDGWTPIRLSVPLDIQGSTVNVVCKGPAGAWENLLGHEQVKRAHVDTWAPDLIPAIPRHRRHVDDDLVAEGVALVRNGDVSNAHQAAIRLAPKAKGMSEAANVDRLERKIGQALGPSHKSPKHPETSRNIPKDLEAQITKHYSRPTGHIGREDEHNARA